MKLKDIIPTGSDLELIPKEVVDQFREETVKEVADLVPVGALFPRGNPTVYDDRKRRENEWVDRSTYTRYVTITVKNTDPEAQGICELRLKDSADKEVSLSTLTNDSQSVWQESLSGFIPPGWMYKLHAEGLGEIVTWSEQAFGVASEKHVDDIKTDMINDVLGEIPAGAKLPKGAPIDRLANEERQADTWYFVEKKAGIGVYLTAAAISEDASYQFIVEKNDGTELTTVITSTADNWTPHFNFSVSSGWRYKLVTTGDVKLLGWVEQELGAAPNEQLNYIRQELLNNIATLSPAGIIDAKSDPVSHTPDTRPYNEWIKNDNTSFRHLTINVAQTSDAPDGDYRLLMRQNEESESVVIASDTLSEKGRVVPITYLIPGRWEFCLEVSAGVTATHWIEQDLGPNEDVQQFIKGVRLNNMLGENIIPI